jgi:hypothetical protein
MDEFDWTDVWVLWALLYAQKPAPRDRVRGSADFVARARISDEKLDGGLAKLAAAGLASCGPDGWDVAGRALSLWDEIDRAMKAAGDHSPMTGWDVVGRFLGVPDPDA